MYNCGRPNNIVSPRHSCPIPGNCDYARLHGQGETKVADGIKVAYQMALK